MRNRVRTQIYLFALLLIYLAWTSHMLLANRWHIFADWWPMLLTMVLGSFMAGALAEGAAAVAFPVFTKLLQIPAHEARTFGLMIQAVGMTMAGLVIFIRCIKILPGGVGWVSLGGIFAANTGSGIDTLTFVVLTLAFGINEKVSTPTTVVIMGLNAVVGFFVHGVVMQDIGIVWE